MPYILDTDHVSLLLRGHEGLARRLAAHPPAEIRVTLVTAQELLEGWLPLLKRREPVERYVWACEGLRGTIEFLCDANLLDSMSGRPRSMSAYGPPIAGWARTT